MGLYCIVRNHNILCNTKGVFVNTCSGIAYQYLPHFGTRTGQLDKIYCVDGYRAGTLLPLRTKTQQIERNIIRKPDYPFEFDKADFVRCIGRFVIIGMHINLHPGDVWNVEFGKGNII